MHKFVLKMKKTLLKQLITMTFVISLCVFFNVVVHTAWLINAPSPNFRRDIEYVDAPPHVPFGHMDFAAKLKEDQMHLMPSKADRHRERRSTTEDETKLPPTQSSEISSQTNGTVDTKDQEAIIIGQLRALVDLVTKPTYFCSKMLAQGGRSCRMIPDGDKKVCLDGDIAPPTNSCLVYSIGIGHDFTYDFYMAKYGCNVFSFDHDYLHSLYNTTRPYKRVYMANVRLGWQVEYKTVVDTLENKTFTYFYRPLDNIMYVLGHDDSNLDVLKVDIEGSEYEVFEKSIFKTDILERTRQLAIEMHFNEYFQNDSLEVIGKLTQNYNRFFTELKSRGFELAYYQPNFLSTEALYSVRGIMVPIFFELVWINTRVKPGLKPRYGKKLLRRQMNTLQPDQQHLIQSSSAK